MPVTQAGPSPEPNVQVSRTGLRGGWPGIQPGLGQVTGISEAELALALTSCVPASEQIRMVRAVHHQPYNTSGPQGSEDSRSLFLNLIRMRASTSFPTGHPLPGHEAGVTRPREWQKPNGAVAAWWWWWGRRSTGRKSSEAHEHVMLGHPGREEQGCVEIGGDEWGHRVQGPVMESSYSAP